MSGKACCPLCHSSHLRPLLYRESVPVFQNALARTQAEALNSPTGTLDVVTCEQCGFIFNTAFDPDMVTYTPDYENDQTLSPSFLSYVDTLCDHIISDLKNSGGNSLIEVGCGQGKFLEQIHERAEGLVMRAWGFDPAFRGTILPPGIKVEQRMFGEADLTRLTGQADGVLSRHVIEHIQDPVAFLVSLLEVAGSDAFIYIETPCLEWVLQKGMIQDFFYEHCNYFSAATLTLAMKLAGFGPMEVTRVFGDQYLWVKGQSVSAAGLKQIEVQHQHIDFELQTQFEQQVLLWRRRLEDARSKGGVALWGGAAKGATFASIVDPDRQLLECLIDINPRKQGRYVLCSSHAIVSPEEAADLGVRMVWIMNPNYQVEITGMVEQRKLPFEIFTVEGNLNSK